MDGESVSVDWIMEQLRSQRLPQRQLAEALDIAPSGVSRLLAGTRRLKPGEASIILEFLQAQRQEPRLETETPAGSPRGWEYTDSRRPDGGVPVHVLEKTGEGTYRQGEIGEFRRVPAGLAGARGVHAFYIGDDGLDPMLLRGDVVFVHPTRPAFEGARVLARAVDGTIRIGRFYGAGGKPRIMVGEARLALDAETKLSPIILIETH